MSFFSIGPITLFCIKGNEKCQRSLPLKKTLLYAKADKVHSSRLSFHDSHIHLSRKSPCYIPLCGGAVLQSHKWHLQGLSVAAMVPGGSYHGAWWGARRGKMIPWGKSIALALFWQSNVKWETIFSFGEMDSNGRPKIGGYWFARKEIHFHFSRKLMWENKLGKRK